MQRRLRMRIFTETFQVERLRQTTITRLRLKNTREEQRQSCRYWRHRWDLPKHQQDGLSSSPDVRCGNLHAKSRKQEWERQGEWSHGNQHLDHDEGGLGPGGSGDRAWCRVRAAQVWKPGMPMQSKLQVNVHHQHHRYHLRLLISSCIVIDDDKMCFQDIGTFSGHANCRWFWRRSFCQWHLSSFNIIIFIIRLIIRMINMMIITMMTAIITFWHHWHWQCLIWRKDYTSFLISLLNYLNAFLSKLFNANDDGQSCHFA